jgi:hypothetical protein
MNIRSLMWDGDNKLTLAVVRQSLLARWRKLVERVLTCISGIMLAICFSQGLVSLTHPMYIPILILRIYLTYPSTPKGCRPQWDYNQPAQREAGPLCQR